MLLGNNHPNNENMIDSKKYHIFYDKKGHLSYAIIKKLFVSFNSLMYILQNIEKSQDAKGFTFSKFWVKIWDFNHFHEITVICAIKYKVHNFCLTKFFWKFVIKYQLIKIRFLCNLCHFPSFDFTLSNTPIYSLATNYKNQCFYIFALCSFHKIAFSSV